ncbi:MAG: hypothetical protein Q9165_004190 [Trypethelium subeluteriae]
MSKPVVLHLGDDIKWNHALYKQLQDNFHIVRSYSMAREEFKQSLKTKKFGDFVAIYRPFWNTGAACTESVADAAIWLILSTYRLFSWSSQAARSLSVSSFKDANRNIAATTYNPRNSILGIIGLGKIGYLVAQKAKAALGMKIVYNDIRRIPEDIEKTVDAVYYPKLEDMLAIADCAVVATPFGGEKVLSAASFQHFKPGSRIVNVARGKLIDEPALVEALESGRLFAAGLDVHYDEPVVNRKLAGMRNVEILSHTAGASVDSHVGFERLGIENILSFFETGKALTPVNIHWMENNTSKL